MFSLLPSIVAVYFILVGIVIWRGTEKKPAHMAFVGLCLTTFVWQISWALLFQVEEADIAQYVVKLGYLFIIFLPTLLYHFLAAISRDGKELRFVKISYGLATVLAVIHLSSDLFVSGVYDYYWGFYPKAGDYLIVHVTQTVVVVTRGLYVTYKALSRTDDPERSKLKYCIASLFIYSLAAVDYLCNYGVEFYPPGIIFITISLSIIAFALLKKDLMDIKLVVTSVGARAILLVLVTLTFILIYFVPSPNIELTILLCIFAGWFWAEYGDRFRAYIQTGAEKKWITDWYDESEVIAKIAWRLQTILLFREVAEVVASYLVDMLSIYEARVIIFSDDGWISKGTKGIEEELIPEDNWLLKYFDEHSGKVMRCQDIPEDMRMRLTKFHAGKGEVILVLHSSSEVKGFIVLGKRISGRRFGGRSLHLMESVMEQAIVYIDRAEVYRRLLDEERIQHQEKLLLSKSLVGNISYELRAPLMTIQMATKALEKHISNTPHEGVEYLPDYREGELVNNSLNTITHSVSQAQNIINLLTANVSDEVIDEADFQLFSTLSVIKKALHEYPFHSGEEQKVKLDESVDFECWGASLLFVAVVQNMVRNSLYYLTGRGDGVVLISLRQDGEWNYVHVRDNGEGIPRDVLPCIFDEFYTTKPKDIGNGIGLTFCKRVVESFGGEIHCDSEVGSYTEFVIALPKIKDE